MPKNIISRSSTGIEKFSGVNRSGHNNKIITYPDPVAYVNEMNEINEKFFQPYFDNPLNVDLENIYDKLLEFFEGQKTSFRSINPDLIAQINFIMNAMTLVRKDASQYFLLNLQNAAISKEIENSIQCLIMNIYMLNTKISILTSYEGDGNVSGKTKVEIAKFKDPRYMMAEFQPDLSMLAFLYPNDPVAKYYTRLTKLLHHSGLYTSKNEITEDMTRFLDRFLVKHNLSLTLQQWLEIKENEKIKENEELLTTEKLELEENLSDCIKDISNSNIYEPEKYNYYFPACSTTRKKICKSKNNKTRKNFAK